MIRRIPTLFVLALGALVSAASPAWAHDPALTGIRVLYRRHDVVVTVTTALSRLSQAERWNEASAPTEAEDTAIRRRLKLRFDGNDLVWPKANVIEDRAGDLLCWQTVIPHPDHTVKALGPLYPEDPGANTILTILRDGQAVEEVQLTVAPPTTVHKRSAAQTAQGLKEAFTRSITTNRLTPSLLLVALGVAFLFGALHALSPGHGKTMVAAALVGTRGTVGHAVLLGAVVTITHTIGVFALGLITLSATQRAVPERLYPLLTALSGAMILCVGASLLIQLLRKRHKERNQDERSEEEDEGEGCAIPIEAKLSLRSLLALGVTGGAAPCPSALVVMLSAMALHRIAFGLALILAFSLGLAVVLTVIGLIVVRVGSAMERTPRNARLISHLPMVSATTIFFTGVVFMVRAFHGGN